MNNMQIRDFAKKVHLLLPDTTNRRILLPTIVGMAVGNFLQVTQGEDVNPLTVFNSMHTGNVARVVSCLNEEILMDIPTVLEAAKTMYMVRHRIVNCQPAMYSVNPEFDFMSVALGLSAVVPAEVHQVLVDNNMASVKLYTLANMMIADLKKTGCFSL